MVVSDLSEIQSELVRKVLCETAENQLNSKEIQITVSSASKDGASNFNGCLYRATICKQNGGEDESSGNDRTMLNFILKVAPQSLIRRMKCVSRPCFLREIQLYKNILPTFRNFEQSKGVPDADGFNEYPECYQTSDVDLNECVILEDLSARKFLMLDKGNEFVTADHVRLVMECLAKLHAVSFALKDQQPHKFAELTCDLSENFFYKDAALARSSLGDKLKLIFGALSKDSDKHLLQKCQTLFEKHPLDILVDCVDPSMAEPATVINHGDAWINNFLFRYDNNGKPIEASLLDWQMSRHSSPVIDIVYFIYCCTTKELRDTHYDEFLKIYHDCLSAQIRRLGSDPEKLFPFELMLEHLRRRAKFALIMAMIVLPIITSDVQVDLEQLSSQSDDNKSKSVGNMLVTDKSRRILEKYLKDIIFDMVKLEYI